MMRAVTLALVLAMDTSLAFTDDEMTRRFRRLMANGRAGRSRLKDPEGVKHEEEGIYEIDDAKCKMGTMDSSSTRTFQSS